MSGWMHEVEWLLCNWLHAVSAMFGQSACGLMFVMVLTWQQAHSRDMQMLRRPYLRLLHRMLALMASQPGLGHPEQQSQFDAFQVCTTKAFVETGFS